MIYLISFDNSQMEYSQESIHNGITLNIGARDWWHYLPNTYIISTWGNSKRISDALLSMFPNLRLLVIKVDIGDNNGRLNKKAWKWFARLRGTTIRVKPSPPLLSTILKTSSPVKPQLSPLLEIFAKKNFPKFPTNRK